MIEKPQLEFKNIRNKPPQHIPNNVSIDAPLMVNGDVTMSTGYQKNQLRFYLSKNDFWRLRSKADGLSGPRVAGFVDIKIEDFDNAAFTASQLIRNRITTCVRQKNNQNCNSHGNLIENNVYVQVGKIIDGKKEWLNFKSNNWETNNDPGFADWKNANFSVKSHRIFLEKYLHLKKSLFRK